MLVIFALGWLLEACIYLTTSGWQWRRIFMYPTVLLIGFGSSGLLLEHVTVVNILLVWFSIYRIINILRLAEGRHSEIYLRQLATRCWLVLSSLQIALIIFNRLSWQPQTNAALVAAASIQTAIAAVLLIASLRSWRRTRVIPSPEQISKHDMPTVSVAIPARNETPALKSCLEAILRSNYPKLEVLVLDDCSQDGTSEVIRSFAHSGVRFLRGDEPADRWLAKNQAYQQLYEAATGEFMLFCDVDIRVQPDTLRMLVSDMQAHHKQMVCVLPLQINQASIQMFMQPLRNWWHLALPRRLFNKPPVVNRCWMIKRAAIRQNGTFKAVSHSVLAEAHFAMALLKEDAYRFIRSDAALGVTTTSQPKAEIDRSIRRRYPEVHHRLEWVSLLSLAETASLLLPFVLVGVGVAQHTPALTAIALAAGLLLLITQVLMYRLTQTAGLGLSIISFPFNVLSELVLLNLSMWRYEFGVVDWRGRNICLPVLQHEQRLARLTPSPARTH